MLLSIIHNRSPFTTPRIGRCLVIAWACLASAGAPRAAEPWPQDFGGFLQSAPTVGAAPTRRTELRLWHDATTLFVDIHAFDPEPDGIVARQMRRDVEGMLYEDQVTLVIDAEGTGRHGYLFAVNALGAQFDALIYDGGQMRRDWDAQWESEARIEPDGWSAQLAIPLSVFGRGEAASWRMNAERWMPRGSELVRLAGLQPDRFVYSLGDGIAIPAIRSERSGWGLRIKPSLRAVAQSSAASGTGRKESRLEPSLEIFHDSESGLRVAAALNIDFGEAEADERVVNLERFELFQPEKREFFLRDAGRFSFGGLNEDSPLQPYYSRRIGLDPLGRPRGLDAGLKLTGHVGGMDLGAFGARVEGGPTTPGLADQPSADVAVLRVARPVDEHHRAGLITTRGNPQGTGGSRLWGADYQFRDTAWAGDKTLEANAWAMQSANPGANARARVNGQAWGGNMSYVNIGPMAEAWVQRVGKGFDPALGYLAEDKVLRGNGTVGWWHHTEEGADVIPAVDWEFRRTLDGRERTLVWNPEIEFSTPAGDTFMGELFHEEDRLALAYEPVPGTRIAPGSYGWNYLYGVVQTAQSRSLSLTGELRVGGYYDGRRDDQIVTLGWKPDAHWEARVGIGRNALHLPAGDFAVKLATLRLDHTPSTRLAESLLLQWDNVSQSLGASARLRWLWSPGQEAVLAIDRLSYTGDRPAQQSPQTQAMLKLVWNFER